jgi:hypothetical protein
VRQLQETLGDSECSGQAEAVPVLKIDELLDDVDDLEKRRHYQAELRQFFRDPKKQEQLGFATRLNEVTPTRRLYSLSCRLSKFFGNPHRQLDLFYLLVILVVGSLGVRWWLGRSRVGKMYDFLRLKVLAAPEQILNVTHTMADLEAEFGAIDEQTWGRINDVRTSRKEIGYFEDDFLYWKVM